MPARPVGLGRKLPAWPENAAMLAAIPIAEIGPQRTHTTEHAPMFGFTEEQITQFGMTFGIGAFMLYMIFIIANLAWKSKAGKTGTFWLFLALGLGMTGFLAKLLIEYIIEKNRIL